MSFVRGCQCSFSFLNLRASPSTNETDQLRGEPNTPVIRDIHRIIRDLSTINGVFLNGRPSNGTGTQVQAPCLVELQDVYVMKEALYKGAISGLSGPQWALARSSGVIRHESSSR